MEEINLIYKPGSQVLTIVLPKELDHHSSKSLKEQTDIFLKGYPIRQMIFDFSNTDFMDSSGIGILLARYKWMKQRGGQVSLRKVNCRIDRILKLSGIYQIIPKTEE